MGNYNYYIDYFPRIGGNVVIDTIYFVLLVIHVILWLLAKDMFFPVCFVVGCALEYIGFFGRVMGHYLPYTLSWFMIQSIGITIAPIFFMAGIYNSFGEMIPAYGEKYSVLKPATYKKIFIVSDAISLIFQAGGGGVAAYLASANNPSQAGEYIMLGALAFQVLSMSIYICLVLIFFCRVRNSVKSGGTLIDRYSYMRNAKFFKAYVWGIFISTIFVYIRCIYRVAEMSHGVNGPLTRNENWFLIFDASMVICGVTVLTCTYPGAALGKGYFSRFYPQEECKVCEEDEPIMSPKGMVNV